MMRHERPDGDTGLAGRQTRRRVIHRLVKAVSASAPFGGETFQVFTRFPGRDHQRHQGRIRSDHKILRQAPLQAQARHAKGAILIVQMNVGPVVSRFGNAPRHTMQLAIRDLLRNRSVIRLIE